MKRIGSIICLVAIMVVMTVSTCFAAESTLTYESYPYDGMKNTTTENMCVKLTFNNEVGHKDIQNANRKCFKITSKDGKTTVPIKVFVNPKQKNQVLVLADTTKQLKVKDDTEYTLYISGKFTDNFGNTLGKDSTVTFKTMNQGRSTRVYMFMMVLMFVGIFVISSRQMKKHAKEEMQMQQKEEAFNPYKEAKKTGKPVEEIIAQHEKEVAKREAKKARKAKKAEKAAEEEDEYYAPGHYGVKGPRPISAAGGKYITGRKAEAEEKARKAAARKKKK